METMPFPADLATSGKNFRRNSRRLYNSRSWIKETALIGKLNASMRVSGIARGSLKNEPIRGAMNQVRANKAKLARKPSQKAV